eukprot:COSAG01_NODE_1552_length_9933_cov_13.631483_5_plen_112_part_00
MPPELARPSRALNISCHRADTARGNTGPNNRTTRRLARPRESRRAHQSPAASTVPSGAKASVCAGSRRVLPARQRCLRAGPRALVNGRDQAVTYDALVMRRARHLLATAPQ